LSVLRRKLLKCMFIYDKIVINKEKTSLKLEDINI
jgi:hypothetical protein